MDETRASHTTDILMYDVVPPFQSKGLVEYKKHGTFFSNTAPEDKVLSI